MGTELLNENGDFQMCHYVNYCMRVRHYELI